MDGKPLIISSSHDRSKTRPSTRSPLHQHETLHESEETAIHQRPPPLGSDSEALEHDSAHDLEEYVEDDDDQPTKSPPRPGSTSPRSVGKGKSRALEPPAAMSSSSNYQSRTGSMQYYDRERTASSTSGRRPDMLSRTSTTSNTSTATSSRQGSEDPRGGSSREKKEDRGGNGSHGGGGTSGSRSGGGGSGSGSVAGPSASSRSRLVSGVFVRY